MSSANEDLWYCLSHCEFRTRTEAIQDLIYIDCHVGIPPRNDVFERITWRNLGGHRQGRLGGSLF